MSIVNELKKKIFAGQHMEKSDALLLASAPIAELSLAADQIRAHFCSNTFDMCTIINGKCGSCSEDCSYCAQSAHYETTCQDDYPLLDTAEIVNQAKSHWSHGALRYSIVTSGRRLSCEEIDQVSIAIEQIKEETGLKVCISFGLLEESDFRKLKSVGVSRVHCNLESSEDFFPQICSTHTWQEKVETLKAAQRAGLEICSGGIMGLGETMEDRIDMVLAIRQLGVKSVPVNLLNPIPGTPCENNTILSEEELCRIVALFRFLIPDGFIRLAGGRGLLSDLGKACFQSGANATISGDMLTTAGYSVKTDMTLLKDLGYEVKIHDE